MNLFFSSFTFFCSLFLNLREDLREFPFSMFLAMNPFSELFQKLESLFQVVRE